MKTVNQILQDILAASEGPLQQVTVQTSVGEHFELVVVHHATNVLSPPDPFGPVSKPAKRHMFELGHRRVSEETYDKAVLAMAKKLDSEIKICALGASPFGAPIPAKDMKSIYVVLQRKAELVLEMRACQLTLWVDMKLINKVKESLVSAVEVAHYDHKQTHGADSDCG